MRARNDSVANGVGEVYPLETYSYRVVIKTKRDLVFLDVGRCVKDAMVSDSGVRHGALIRCDCGQGKYKQDACSDAPFDRTSIRRCDVQMM